MLSLQYTSPYFSLDLFFCCVFSDLDLTCSVWQFTATSWAVRFWLLGILLPEALSSSSCSCHISLPSMSKLSEKLMAHFTADVSPSAFQVEWEGRKIPQWAAFSPDTKRWICVFLGRVVLCHSWSAMQWCSTGQGAKQLVIFLSVLFWDLRSCQFIPRLGFFACLKNTQS